MVIESRTVVGGAAALALVGIALWISSSLLSPPEHRGVVEVQPVNERSWAVEVKELGPAEQTASR